MANQQLMPIVAGSVLVESHENKPPYLLERIEDFYREANLRAQEMRYQLFSKSNGNCTANLAVYRLPEAGVIQ